VGKVWFLWVVYDAPSKGAVGSLGLLALESWHEA